MQHNSFNDHYYILASKSPRRQFLLKALGIDCDIMTKDVDESFSNSLKAQEIPLYLSEKKADAFTNELKSRSNAVIITADTIVWINDKVLNKPADRNDSIRMLRMLSGNMHEVFTGVCIASSHKKKTFYCRSMVYFKKLSDKDISLYIDNFKPYDKAGSYGAQEGLPWGMNPCSREEVDFLKEIGKTELIESSINRSPNESGIALIEKIDGSYFNVMGLPIKELFEELKQF